MTKQQMAVQQQQYPRWKRDKNRADKILNQIESTGEAGVSDAGWLVGYVRQTERQALKVHNQRKVIADMHEAYDRLRLRVAVDGQVTKLQGLILEAISWFHSFSNSDQPGHHTSRNWCDDARAALRDKI